MSWIITPTFDPFKVGEMTLDLRLAENKSFIDSISGQNPVTFNRASVGSYFDNNGAMQIASSGTPRFDHDPVTKASRGLLVEEQSANLLLNSESLSTQSVTTTTTSHTLSFYGSGSVTLSGTHSATLVGSGGFPSRSSLTFTPTAGTLTLTVSGTVQYAQLEAKTFATSWIPTTSTSVTRLEDQPYVTGSAFSSRFTQGDGTLFFVGEPTSIASGQPPLMLLFPSSNSASFRGLTRRINLGARLTSNADSIDVTQGLVWNSGVRKVAGNLTANNCTLVVDGAVIGTDNQTAFPLSDVDALGIGWPIFNSRAGVWAARVGLFRNSLSPSVMQAITAP